MPTVRTNEVEFLIIKKWTNRIMNVISIPSSFTDLTAHDEIEVMEYVLQETPEQEMDLVTIQ